MAELGYNALDNMLSRRQACPRPVQGPSYSICTCVCVCVRELNTHKRTSGWSGQVVSEVIGAQKVADYSLACLTLDNIGGGGGGGILS
ncbi:hypothetical protein J6590_008773 [Homalodisca vitripennis]|nr:hypothetical protein J6590_008773 [Homalodisca vitripennis]